MPFNIEKFSLDRASLASFKSLNSITTEGSVAVHRYETEEDSLADIGASGYFNELLTAYPDVILRKDLIACAGNDEAGFLVINAISPNITTVNISSALPPGSVDNGDIADQAIDNRTVENNSINAGQKLLDNSIPTSKIENSAITNEKVENGTLTNEKLLNETILQGKLDALIQTKINLIKRIGIFEGVPSGGVVPITSVLPTNRVVVWTTDYGTATAFNYSITVGTNEVTLIPETGAFNSSTNVAYIVFEGDFPAP